MPVVKTDMPSFADNFCSHIGTVLQAVLAAMSQVAQGHIRTSLYKNTVVVHVSFSHIKMSRFYIKAHVVF